MNPKDEFIEVENRIRALTTILNNLHHRGTPSSDDPKDVSSFLRHFVNLLTTGDKKCHNAVAVTGFLLPDGTVSTLVVTQDPFSKSDAKNLWIEDITKSGKSFDEIVNLDRDDNMDLNEYISDLWTTLAYYQSHTDRYDDLDIFIMYRSYRKLFNRVMQDTKIWNVHVVEKISAWTPRPNELRMGSQWFKFPKWLDSFAIPPEKCQMMKTRNRGAPGKEFTEVEFSSLTVGFWAWLLGSLLSGLEIAVKRAEEKVKNDVQGFKEDLFTIAQWCHFLHLYVNWSSCIVENLLTRTSLANAFNLPWVTVRRDVMDDNDDDNDDDDTADMSREDEESDGYLVLRHLRAMVAWSAALDNLTSRKHLSIISGKLDIGLVHVPHAGHDIAGIKDITDEFFKRFPRRSACESGRVQAIANLKRGWKPKFTGTTHAEATLMGLLKYFSELNPSSCVDYWNALQDPKMAERLEVLIGPIATTTDTPIGVGKKCCWCCSTLGSILSQDKHFSIKLPGSHGIIYPWSPPRVGLDVSVLRTLEERLWAELHTAIANAEFQDASSGDER